MLKYLILFSLMPSIIWAKNFSTFIMGNHSPWNVDEKGAYTTSNAANLDGSIIHNKLYALSIEFHKKTLCKPGVSFVIMNGKSLGEYKKNYSLNRGQYYLYVDGKEYMPTMSVGTIYKHGVGYFGLFDIDSKILINANKINIVTRINDSNNILASFDGRPNQKNSIANHFNSCKAF